MIKSVIIDDEPKSRQALSTLLERYCGEVHVVGQAASVGEAVKVLEDETVDLVFLDISMPDGSGFDLLNMPDIKKFEVIFTTAYHEYALQAIKASALDYLLKPINIRELQEAVNKARNKMQAYIPREPDNLLEVFHKKYYTEGKMAVPVNTGLKFIPVKSITRLEAAGAYTRIFQENSPAVLSTRQLKQHEQHLPAHLFFRAHHSHLINLEYIREYHRGDGGYVVMMDGSVVDISKRRKKQFLELFHVRCER